MMFNNPFFFIDVSHHQGLMDWGVAYKEGVRYALIRASNGVTKDREVEHNAENAIKKKIKIGFYHYFQPDINAADQYGRFTETIKPYPKVRRNTLDVEKSGAFLNTNLKQFLDYMPVGIMYTRAEFWRTNVRIPDRYLRHYWLHIAVYGKNDGKLPPKRLAKDVPKPWSRPAAWQYTDKGDGKKYGAGGSWSIDYNIMDRRYAQVLLGIFEPKYEPK